MSNCPTGITCSGEQRVENVGNSSGTLKFNNVNAASAGSRTVTIAYLNGDATARTASMSINGATATTVTFPSTGTWPSPNVGTVNVTISLISGNNTIKFSNTGAWAPDFDKITVN